MMNRQFALGVLMLLVSILTVVIIQQAEAQSTPASSGGYRVETVIFEGNNRVSLDALRMQAPKTPAFLSQSQISSIVKRLYESGFFDQVTVSIVPTTFGKALRIVVTEKPLIGRVYVKGNDQLSESDLREVIGFGERRFLDATNIHAVTRRLVALYQSKGFYDVEVSNVVSPPKEGKVDLTFKIKEGERYKIAEVVFDGLRQIDASDLRSAIETSRYKWWSSWLFGTGRVSPEQLENDRRLIRQYLIDHGFVDGIVGEGEVVKREDRLVVRFTVNEGDLYQVGRVTASGDLIDGEVAKTLEDLDISSGDTFSARELRDASFAVGDKYADRGYAFANIVPDTVLDRTMRKVDINFVIDQGEPTKIDRIRIRGNNKTYDNVIRRELVIAEQDLYSGKKIRRSQQLLERLGYFEEVTITTEPTVEQDKADLVVNVREAATGTFSIGAGYSSSDGALFNARLSEANLFGTGRSLNLDTNIGTERSDVILSYDDRRFNDSFVSFGADVLRTTREFDDFDRELVGGGVTFGYPLEQVFGEWAQDLSFSTKYEYIDADITGVDPEKAAQLVVDSQGRTTSSAVTPQLVRNTLNNVLDPTSGSRQIISYEMAGLGADSEYSLVGVRQQWYQPLFETFWGGDLIFSWRARWFHGESLNDEPFPLHKRFFPGGINSVRGYEARTLGPKDDRGFEYGGNKELVNNLELIFPLVDSAGLRGVVFYDAGQSFDDDQSIRIDDLREAWGYGIRWASPLGPLRLEFGYPIDRQTGESSMVTQFSFGAPF